MSHRINIHTGNILQLADLKRKPGQTPADELYDTLKIQISGFKSPSGEEAIEILPPAEISSKLNPEERNTQKITIKLFLTSSAQLKCVSEALETALGELGAEQADLFLLSWPVGSDFETGLNLWKEMEELVDKEKVISLGVSDIETNQFVELHNQSRIKPEAIQINLENCCIVPPELVLFTRENSIQLLTHNDPHNILPDEAFQKVCPLPKAKVNWVVRYQTLLRCRGIIHNKGYVIYASADVSQ